MKKKTLKNTIVACTIAGMITLGGTASEAALGDRALYQGVNHSDVKELQQGLRKLNFFTHTKDTTYFGSITQTAVKKFQKANGLAVDGSFGPASVKVLKNKLNGNAQSKPVSNPPSPAGNVSNQLSYKRTLKQGSQGADVKQLQLVLKKLGHYRSSIDTSFGAGTKSAVMSFQRAQKISVDGIVGPSTVKTINNVLSGKIAAGKPSAQPNRNDSGKSTTINIINTAKRYLGSRYVFGGSSPSGFDCSGFTQYVYKQTGISIPRATTSQAGIGTTLSKSELEPGDLLIFSNTYKAGPSHAGIYIGNGQFIHAANARKGVTTDSINSAYYSSKFTSGRKVY
ncbi:C40 family peptidase [Tissierella creatinophila]|uniref:Gamma-DL-glutamyl hydrolase n=1 Tax=Tissierella creatinophila DSM 6911 TaxID=1123403 RepID=A0A1U7M8N9_TISCR|nr:peptidoglycan-binding protein [Tissierella creatinophila]OLS03579.1 gamma-DL-glutamyl hydrolase precursor [Tissierella creatinophila DSM 6911]